VKFVSAGELDIVFFFMKDKPLAIEFHLFSYWFGSRQALSSIMLLLGLPALKKLAGLSDVMICALGLVSKMAGLCLLGLSTKWFMIFIGGHTAISFNPDLIYDYLYFFFPTEVFVGCLGNFALTAMRAMMSQCVRAEEMGENDNFFIDDKNKYSVVYLIIGKMFGFFAIFEDMSVLLGKQT
jgi:hypothetical protein